MLREKMDLLLWYIMLTTALIAVSGNVCHLPHTFSCTVEDKELPDKTIGSACVCVSADCIPPTNPCPNVNNIMFEGAVFDFISRNSFSNYSRLNSIDIQSGSVDYIQARAFENQQSLKIIRIAGSKVQVETGAFIGLQSLENLQFEPNIVLLSGELFTGVGPSLKNLDLGSGMITALDNNTFDEFVNLKTLSITYNKLRTIQPRWFARLSKLEELNLAGNIIRSIPSSVFSYLTKLKKLYIQENGITVLEEECFYGLESLEELFLSRNRIQDIDNILTSLKNLTLLAINYNSLETVTKEMFAGLTSLRHLSLSNNAISTITSLPLPNLETLDLSRNVLESLLPYYFKDTNRVSYIYLESNKINKIGYGTFRNLTVLKDLFLDHNELATFSFFDFGNENILQRLNLQYNMLTSISFSTILQPQSLMYLEMLWLGNNRLRTFPSVIFDYAPRLAIDRNTLKLTNNPLTCDCNIKGLSESTRNIILDPEIRENCTQPTCSVPTTMFAHGDISVPVGEETSLICKVTGQPHPLVSWTYNNDVVVAGWYNIITGTAQIYFDKLTTSNFGNYTCTATNNIGSSSVTMNLIEKKIEYQDAGSNRVVDNDNGTNAATRHMPSGITLVFLAVLITHLINTRS